MVGCGRLVGEGGTSGGVPRGLGGDGAEEAGAEKRGWMVELTGTTGVISMREEGTRSTGGAGEDSSESESEAGYARTLRGNGI
jgi:hypothetical protein